MQDCSSKVLSESHMVRVDVVNDPMVLIRMLRMFVVPLVFPTDPLEYLMRGVLTGGHFTTRRHRIAPRRKIGTRRMRNLHAHICVTGTLGFPRRTFSLGSQFLFEERVNRIRFQKQATLEIPTCINFMLDPKQRL